MPYALLLVKPNRGLDDVGKKLAQELPSIVAPALSLGERELHVGKVTPAEIMVWPVFGHETVNGKDLELLVLAHNFPERVANIEERKTQILVGIHEFLSTQDRDATCAVCVLPTLMAYGEIKDLFRTLSGPDALLLLPVYEFFTEERLRGLGADTRTCNTVRNVTSTLAREDAASGRAYKVNCRLMGQFIRHYSTRQHLHKSTRESGNRAGRKTSAFIIEVIQAAGLEYPPPH